MSEAQPPGLSQLNDGQVAMHRTVLYHRYRRTGHSHRYTLFSLWRTHTQSASPLNSGMKSLYFRWFRHLKMFAWLVTSAITRIMLHLFGLYVVMCVDSGLSCRLSLVAHPAPLQHQRDVTSADPTNAFVDNVWPEHYCPLYLQLALLILHNVLSKILVIATLTAHGLVFCGCIVLHTFSPIELSGCAL